jgi:hypothetical protein
LTAGFALDNDIDDATDDTVDDDVCMGTIDGPANNTRLSLPEM